MCRHISRQTEHLVLTYYNPGMSYRSLQKLLKSKNVLVSDKTIKNIIEGKGKRRESELKGHVYRKDQPRPKVTPQVLKLIDRRTSIENPLPQRVIAKQTKVSQSSVGRAIRQDLKKEKRKKTKVHALTEKDKKNRKMNCRKLYERHLAGEKYKFVVTLDESWVRLKVDCGKTEFCYVDRGENIPNEWVKQARHTLGAEVYGGCCNVSFPYLSLNQSTSWCDNHFRILC